MDVHCSFAPQRLWLSILGTKKRAQEFRRRDEMRIAIGETTIRRTN
jgi:hypothetical protein